MCGRRLNEKKGKRKLGATRSGPEWEHVTILKDDDKNPSLSCNHCGHLFRGGAFRIREHLAQKAGSVKKCGGRGSAYKAVRKAMAAAIEQKKAKKTELAAMGEVDEAADGETVSGFTGA